MKIWEAVVLGIVQGATEFLPVSSSGHLLLFEKCGIGEDDLFFNICLHLGTLLAVLIAMRKTWMPLVKKPLDRTNGYIILATIPTVVIAVIFKVFFPALVDGEYLPFGFMATAVLLFLSEKLQTTKTAVYNAKTSVLTGVMQGIAVLPGVSRSGSTIAISTLLGVEKSTASEFSFLLSVPIIVGSALYEGVEIFTSGGEIFSAGIAPLLIGTFTAFLSGLVAIKGFLGFVKKHSLSGFAVYAFLLSVVCFVLYFAL